MKAAARPSRRQRNVLRFWGGSTREEEKSVKLSLGHFFQAPTKVPRAFRPKAWSHRTITMTGGQLVLGLLFKGHWLAVCRCALRRNGLSYTSQSEGYPKILQRCKNYCSIRQVISHELPGLAVFLMEQSIQTSPERAMNFVVEWANLSRSGLRWTLRDAAT